MTDVRDQFRGYRHPFVFGVHYHRGIGAGTADYPRTLVELAMSRFSAEIRRTAPQWWLRYPEHAFREEWAQLARERVWEIPTPSKIVHITLTERQITYILDELAGYAALREPDSGCEVSCFERIWECTMPPDSYSSLITALVPLREEIAHTNTLPWEWDKLGLCTALVDPHLYPLVYNRTLVLPEPPPSRDTEPGLEPQQLHTLPSPSGGDIYTISPTYALLPAEITISPASESSNTPPTAHFTSYINNLHRTAHDPLYTALATLFSTPLLPLFEHTLTDLHRQHPLPQRIRGACRYTIWEEPEEPVHSDDEDAWARYERELRRWAMERPIVLPDVPMGGYPGGLETRVGRVRLSGRTLGVVVGVEEIRLEPGGPSYPGSPWHVEGMRNERIVACGEFYYSIPPAPFPPPPLTHPRYTQHTQDNLTTPTLEFRMATTSPRHFPAGDVGATARAWGLHDRDPSHQHLGARPLSPGLALTWPNLYQHRLGAFALADTLRRGVLGVVRFWLVDPEVGVGAGAGAGGARARGVVSTRRVPPQQAGWVREAVWAALGARLPGELIETIVRWCVVGVGVDVGQGEEALKGPLMEEEEARACARELRAVRERFWVMNDRYHFCIPFDVWSAPEVYQQ
ncbi:hypothetical protein H0H81_002217 [Sphagnurus paluster]|uniref:DUF4246 domain-containing protein n=1 Tax=Sphagnurus paluster TaxID=117069 RepID=A0A9P7FVN5_9AGAR|nr:hypothetical protein H0H81_002217 [Sphagnurus paluster]